jgi:hypothetical protein
MTILVSYKQQDKVVFVSDFRVSFRGANQVDAMSKFLYFDNRLAFFTAGSVRLWHAVIQVIPTVLSQVDFQNVCEEQGPLFCALRNMAEQTPSLTTDQGIFGGFGIYVDPATNRNVVFQIEGRAGLGLRIFNVPDGITVIGSGSFIPEIDHVLQLKMEEFVASNGFFIKPTADKLRSEIKRIIVKCGSSSFEKLGISSIFNIAGLIGSAFQMFGEELKGARFVSGGSSQKYHFLFERRNGAIVLRDKLTKVQVLVHDILTFPYTGSVGVEFDPEGLTQMFDPSSYISGNNIYFISQWVEGANMERIVYKTDSFCYNQKVLANPNYIKIAQSNGRARTKGRKRHKNIYRNGLIVSPINQVYFEQTIKENIMDDIWLSTYIENANELFEV